MKTKRKTYVIKNMVTGKYFKESRGFGAKYTKDIYKALTYDQAWVNDTVKDIRAGERMLGKNESFVEIQIKEGRPVRY